MAFAGINYWAVLLAAAAAWIFGAVWYRVFSKPWLKATARTPEEVHALKGTSAEYRSYLVVLVALIVMAWMLAGVLGHLGPGQVTVRNGVISAVFSWLGFVATVIVVSNTFARRPLLLTVIDGGYWLGSLVLMGAVVGLIGVP